MWFSWSLLLERAPGVLYFSQPRISASRHPHNKSRIPVSVSQESEISFDISIAETAKLLQSNPTWSWTTYCISFFTLINWYYSQRITTKSIPSKKPYIKFKCIGNLKWFHQYQDPTPWGTTLLIKRIKEKFVCWYLLSSCEKDISTTHTLA